jgi:hypothetical protein
MSCPNCRTQPPLIEVKVNIFVCPVCDLIVIKQPSNG